MRTVFDPEGGRDLRRAFFAFIRKSCRNSEAVDQCEFPVFLVLTAFPGSRRENGLSIPSELVIGVDEVDRIGERIRQLQIVHQDGLDVDLLRSMCVGVFRKALFMDDDNHGMGEMDPFQFARYPTLAAAKEGWITKDKDGSSQFWPNHVIKQIEEINSKTGTDDKCHAFRVLFGKELIEIAAVMEAAIDSKAEKTPAELAASIDRAYPRRSGVDLSVRLPQNRGIALLIDDEDVDGVGTDRMEDVIIDGSAVGIPNGSAVRAKLGRTYEFVRLRVTDDDAKGLGSKPGCGFGSLLRDKLTGLGDLRRFDLVLLDLCLGEGHGEDPRGYHLLPALRNFFPQIPIVVYTKFRDMGHIERAFRQGADWFLSKGEAGKLPVHHLDLIDNPHWEREWKAVRNLIEWDLPVGPDLHRDFTKHLIWKAVGHMPGGRICVRELRGGIGGASTLHASREINGRYDRAAPEVIKIDRVFDMLLERERYQRFIQPYLSNLAGRIDVPLQVGGSNLGAISYTYAGNSQGRRGDRREVTTLEALLQMNLPRGSQEIRPARDYEELFRTLLEENLRRIHSIDPRGEPSEVDFPNLVFGESPTRVMDRHAGQMSGKRVSPEGSAVDSYLTRMPPESEIELEQPFTSQCVVGTKVYVYDVVKPDRQKGEQGRLQCLTPCDDGLLHRVDLCGLLGPFYAEHRYFRPMQPLWIAETINRDGQCFRKQWLKLWEEKNEKDEKEPRRTLNPPSKLKTKDLCFNFAAARLGDVGSGKAAEVLVCNLVGWLTESSKRPRQALESGRIGIIHGDTNLGNVMVERERGKGPEPVHSAPWLIDFARTKRDWIVLDYTQLEMDLCTRLIRHEFFKNLTSVKGSQDWTEPDDFISHFLETPWQDPPCAKSNPRLQFVYHLMRQVRNAADHAGVRDEEYLASRVWQCLIVHKILCGQWRKNEKDTSDPDLQFRCVWSLKQAFQTARILGWDPKIGS